MLLWKRWRLFSASNLTIDGITINKGGAGLILRSARNVTVRCSNFIELGNSGVLVDVGGSGSDQIKIYQNNFINNSTGCNYNNMKDCSGHLADGSPVANMDYGVRIYNAGTVDIQKNTFGTLFNHSISMKSNVTYTYVSGNTFNKCGRNCLEPGQEPNTTKYPNRTSGQMVVTNNTFNDVPSSATVVLVKNIHRVTFTGNTLNNVTARLYSLYNFKPGQSWNSGGTVIGTGVPLDRSVNITR